MSTTSGSCLPCFMVVTDWEPPSEIYPESGVLSSTGDVVCSLRRPAARSRPPHSMGKASAVIMCRHCRTISHVGLSVVTSRHVLRMSSWLLCFLRAAPLRPMFEVSLPRNIVQSLHEWRIFPFLYHNSETQFPFPQTRQPP